MSNPADIPADVAAKLLRIRDALVRSEPHTPYHELYSIADPGFTSFDPWRPLQQAAGDEYVPPPRQAPSTVLAPGDTYGGVLCTCDDSCACTVRIEGGRRVYNPCRGECGCKACAWVAKDEEAGRHE